MATCKAKIISRMYRVFDSRGIKSADLKGEFYVLSFWGFLCYHDVEKCHRLPCKNALVRQIKVTKDWFGHICNFYQRLEDVREIGPLVSFLCHK